MAGARLDDPEIQKIYYITEQNPVYEVTRRAAENEVLHHFLESLEVVLRAGREAVERPGGGRPRQSLQEHQDILDALACIDDNRQVSLSRVIAAVPARMLQFAQVVVIAPEPKELPLLR